MVCPYIENESIKMVNQKVTEILNNRNNHKNDVQSNHQPMYVHGALVKSNFVCAFCDNK